MDVGGFLSTVHKYRTGSSLATCRPTQRHSVACKHRNAELSRPPKASRWAVRSCSRVVLVLLVGDKVNACIRLPNARLDIVWRGQ